MPLGSATRPHRSLRPVRSGDIRRCVTKPVTCVLASAAIVLASCGPVVTPTPMPARSAPPIIVPATAVPGEPQAGDTRVLGQTGITLVYVPAGEFWMGSTDGDWGAGANEKPQHRVYLDGYWIGRTEVTNAQYGQFVDAGGYSQREYWTDEGWQWKESQGSSGPSLWTDAVRGQADYPVAGVSWYEAAAYARWAGARLPSEAEWEKAARGTDGRTYPWGNSFDGTRLNYCDKMCTYDWKDYAVNDGYVYTAPVGHYEGGASPYGALDMAGNVWEWAADWYGETYYTASPQRNPGGPGSGSYRVLRGGSCFLDAAVVRCAYRWWINPDHRSYYLGVGFRVAR